MTTFFSFKSFKKNDTGWQISKLYLYHNHNINYDFFQFNKNNNYNSDKKSAILPVIKL